MPRTTTVRSSPKSGRDQRPSLLVLQFDTQKLRTDGLDFGDAARIVGIISALGLLATVEVVETTTDAELREKLDAFAASRRRFDVVACIGHGNAKGVRVASDKFAEWDEFGDYLRKVRPRRLLLVACQSGGSPAADTLFSKLRDLRRIVASPVNVSKQAASFMVAVVPYMVATARPAKNVVLAAQAAAVLLTGRQLREWQRNADKDNPTGRLLDFAAAALDPHARAVAAKFRSLF